MKFRELENCVMIEQAASERMPPVTYDVSEETA